MRGISTVKRIMRKKRFQPCWELMLDVVLYGMNIGPASLPHDSGEIFLLNNLRKILGKPRDAVDVIQFEFGGCNIDSRAYFHDFFYLLNPKYRLFRLTVDGLVAIDRYHEKFEQFQTTNFAAIHRKLRTRDGR